MLQSTGLGVDVVTNASPGGDQCIPSGVTNASPGGPSGVTNASPGDPRFPQGFPQVPVENSRASTGVGRVVRDVGLRGVEMEPEEIALDARLGIDPEHGRELLQPGTVVA